MSGLGGILGFGTIGRLLNSQNTDDAWREASLQYRDMTGPQQQSLYGPLASFYQDKLGSNPLDFLNNGFGQDYYNSILQPALQGYLKQGVPAINTQFSGINGIFNTRRDQALANGLTGIYTNAQSQYAQAIPQLAQLQYLPAQQALQFALTQTRGTSTLPAGSGSQALTAFGGSI